MNSALKTKGQWEGAYHRCQQLRLPVHNDKPKNWDTLAALDHILKYTDKNAFILDAGAEQYSTILPSLYLFRYRNLFGINLVFKEAVKHGPIVYEQGDLTATRFNHETFDAITCLSVIEHGVDLEKYFEEMSRILKPGGTLITSTDYFQDKIDTGDKEAYGTRIMIFNQEDIEEAVQCAEKYGLYSNHPINYTSQNKAVRWERFDLGFTFIVFALSKKLRKKFI